MATRVSTVRATPAQGVRHILRELCAVRWRPNADLAAVGISWVLVVASLSAATFTATGANGIPYFLLYAVLGATVFGFGLPVAWMALVRHRPLADLGLTTWHWKISLVLQVVFAAVQFRQTLASAEVPPLVQLVPVVSLVLAIGLFEAVFWRGWVLLRLEEAFGLIPAMLVGSALYAAYHVGYGMSVQDMGFLFGIGVMYAAAFRLTRSVLILVPFFQPMGQLYWMLHDGLGAVLPLEATLGFVDVLAAMATIAWWVERRRHSWQP
jgi:membrane protease YdiL (CAAX protease family)